MSPTSCRRLVALVPILFAGAIGATERAALGGDTPEIAREFRAAWIATVANIDWPSKPGLSSETQRRELIELLDIAQNLRMNAVVLQVRPACDALYRSRLEPWSEFLTGTMGKEPDDGYDPLEFAVAQAHRRGLELHAWFNPYRASHPSGDSLRSADHISNLQPDVVRKYGKYLWLDPGEPGASEHSRRVIVDVVERYDIDAVHFDDYFYPYPIQDDAGDDVSFPDDPSWTAYVQQTDSQHRLSRDDWRRENVNRFLRLLAEDIKKTKPWVRFGISPFGIYRPGQPESIVGFDSYAELYADSQLWLREGIVDYFSPQLYWRIEPEAQSFPVLLDWWESQNSMQRHLWPGLFTSKVLAKGEGWPPSEIAEQIDIIRAGSGAPGHIHFSMQAIAQNLSGLKDLLRDHVYKQPALPPPTTWLNPPGDADIEPTIHAEAGERQTRIDLLTSGGTRPWLWVVQWRLDGQWNSQIVPGMEESILVDGSSMSIDDIAVRTVDRLNRLGKVVHPVARAKQ